jgi:ribonucleoside-diphosphate reductase beta chain
MAGTSDIIRTINRDELSHVRLYQSLLPEAMQTFSISFSSDTINQMVHDSVNHEIRWSQHIIGDGILGINLASTEQYLKYLANARLKAIGLEPIYDSQKNPYAHLEKFADTKGDADTKSNFFESTVTSYMMSEALEGWNEF